MDFGCLFDSSEPMSTCELALKEIELKAFYLKYFPQVCSKTFFIYIRFGKCVPNAFLLNKLLTITFNQMKKKQILSTIVLCLILTSVYPLQAQDDPASIVIVTRAHWNMEYEDFSMDEWKKVESEIHEKVVMKNEFITHTNVLMHYYTPDMSEILFVQAYSNWENVEKATKRNSELAKEAWPDEDERKAIFKKQRAYYTNMHSDEIYSGLPLAKNLSEKPTEPLIYYARTMRSAWPEDGKVEEIKALRKEFIENVINKNDDILAYYPMRHLYGADSRDIVEVFVLKSMVELEAMNDTSNSELIDAHWPDEEKRKEFFKSAGKYRERWHSDLIYTNVPELMK